MALVASLLTLLVVARIWIEAFWKPAPAASDSALVRPLTGLLVLPIGVLSVLTLAIGVAAAAGVRAVAEGRRAARRPDRVPARRPRSIAVTAFLWNLMLALAWVAMTGGFTPMNFVLGFLLGYVILVFSQRVLGSTSYFVKGIQVVSFAVFFARELILANLRVAYDVITPGYHIRPAIIAVPLDAKTDAEITMLANLITITPGSFSLEVSADRSVLYVHAMYVDDPEAFRREIKDGFERRVLELLR